MKIELRILPAHVLALATALDFLPKMRHELLAVICKYVKINQEQVNVQLQRTENCSVLELNITLPSPTELTSEKS